MRMYMEMSGVNLHGVYNVACFHLLHLIIGVGLRAKILAATATSFIGHSGFRMSLGHIYLGLGTA